MPRPLAELYEHLREFFVYEDKDLIVGTCALHICWEDLAEIRSLVVTEEVLEIPKVFALTRVPEFFEKLGFRKVTRNELPHKVWADCIRCSKFPECDEVPVIKEI